MKKAAKKLERALNPRSVAVVGDKLELDYMWLRCMNTFQGKVYSVQIDEKQLPGIEALGVKNYPNLLDIPGPVDYVVVAVPRTVAPKIIEDCIRKKVAAVSLFTSGFAETNTEEGIRLQNIITDMAKKSGLNLIGPNCMGVFNPKIGLRNSVDQYSGESGPVGFLSQSGTHAIFFSLVGAVEGVKISKSVSYGNAVILDSTDYLEYLAEDEETRVIGMYIEGIKDGRRLFSILKEVAKKKPVLIWKGGMTEEGTRATASHTGSLAESAAVWEAVIRQCGAIRVDSLEEMVDVVKALLYLKPTTQNRVGLLAMTGGQSVVITDTFAAQGLEVPLLTEQSYQRFSSFFIPVGGSYLNPLDAAFTLLTSADSLAKMLDILHDDENIDTVIMELSAGLMARWWQLVPSLLENLLDTLASFRERSQKPFLAILVSAQQESLSLEIRNKLVELGVPSYPTFYRGARALKKVIDYYRFHSS